MAEGHKQEYMVKNLTTGFETFFFKHSFKSARQHAEEFLERNKGKAEYQLYQLNESVTRPERWLEVRGL